MADVERLLLAKVLREQDMVGFTEAQITDRLFRDEEHLAVLAWMREHWREHGSSPSIQALKANYPTYRLPDTPEPLSWYISQLRKAYRYDTVGRAVSEAAEWIEDDGDEEEAIKTLTAALNDVSELVTPLKDHNLTDPDAFDRLYEFYEMLSRNPGSLRGLGTGWPTIDLATMGLQPGQLVTVVGPPKAGKSTVLLSLADAVQRAGHDTLFISFEMSYEEQAARWTGIRAHLNYRRLLKGQMNDFDRKRLDKLLNKLDKGEQKLILSEDVSATTTVSGIIAKIQQHRPKLLVIDGVYLMDDENGEPKGSSAAITNITRSLKRVAQIFGIPIVISTQTLFSKMRGQSIKASSIGYSSSFGQDSDTVIAVEPREDEDGVREHWLKVLLSRTGPLVEVQIDFDWTTSTFTEFAATYDTEDPDLEDDGEVDIA